MKQRINWVRLNKAIGAIETLSLTSGEENTLSNEEIEDINHSIMELYNKSIILKHVFDAAKKQFAATR